MLHNFSRCTTFVLVVSPSKILNYHYTLTMTIEHMYSAALLKSFEIQGVARVWGAAGRRGPPNGLVPHGPGRPWRLVRLNRTDRFFGLFESSVI
jgi:hypothetical protein